MIERRAQKPKNCIAVHVTTVNICEYSIALPSCTAVVLERCLESKEPLRISALKLLRFENGTSR